MLYYFIYIYIYIILVHILSDFIRFDFSNVNVKKALSADFHNMQSATYMDSIV